MLLATLLKTAPGLGANQGLGRPLYARSDASSGKTMLFRAIAGLWPWGSGRIALPSSNSVMFVPRHPYVPLGTLRGALAYPLQDRLPRRADHRCAQSAA